MPSALNDVREIASCGANARGGQTTNLGRLRAGRASFKLYVKYRLCFNGEQSI